MRDPPKNALLPPSPERSNPAQSSSTASLGQMSQVITINTFRALAVHIAPAMPKRECANSPPRMAPTRHIDGAPTLRLRSGLSARNSSASLNRSQ